LDAGEASMKTDFQAQLRIRHCVVATLSGRTKRVKT
jgi:hypothetical protein